MKQHLINNIIDSVDPETLVILLELTNEEIVESFRHKFDELSYKFECDEGDE
ncbi:MAG: hypothetical protein GQ474_07910 [Sulfurimonas sp.]|nr:hypothetical protein [Sulfurimonas sp.]